MLFDEPARRRILPDVDFTNLVASPLLILGLLCSREIFFERFRGMVPVAAACALSLEAYDVTALKRI